MAAEVTSSPTQFHIPDLLAKWPFKRTLNPAYTTIKAQTEVWMQNFGAFDVESRKRFEKAIPDLLVSLTYPEAPLKELQLAADQMAIFFFIDDLSDACNTVQARALGDVIMDALSNPATARPEGETVLGKIHQSLGARLADMGSAVVFRRFVKRYGLYMDAVCHEAKDRENSFLRDSESYMSMRRDTIGTKPCFDLILLSSTLGDKELNDPVILELEKLATDMIIWTNDICSYNVEQSRGEDKHNIITITMHEKRLSVQEAIDVVGYDFQSLVARFVAIQKSHLGIWNDDMKFYVRGLGNWVTGNYEWSHENVRYRLGEEVRKTGVVELLPRRIGL